MNACRWRNCRLSSSTRIITWHRSSPISLDKTHLRRFASAGHRMLRHFLLMAPPPLRPSRQTLRRSSRTLVPAMVRVGLRRSLRPPRLPRAAPPAGAPGPPSSSARPHPLWPSLLLLRPPPPLSHRCGESDILRRRASILLRRIVALVAWVARPDLLLAEEPRRPRSPGASLRGRARRPSP